MSLTRELTALIRAKRVDDDDLEAAAAFVLDTLACAYGGRRSRQGEMLIDWYVREPRDTERQALLFAALVHVLEIDDLHRRSVTHPGCVVIPAAWAVAARSGIGGRGVLTAVLQGYEALCRIGNAVGPAHYRIWHNTATCGPYGSAFAVAALAGLDDEQTVWALGNAGTQSSGLWQFLDEGAMSKHLHAGRAAESGLVAAELAARGFTGPAAILEGPKAFFAAACPDAEPGRVLENPTAPWQLRLTSIKPWPSCRHTHPTVEAALALHGRVRADAIAHIGIETYQAALDLCDNAAPASEYEAKFSLHHCAAAALVEGALTLSSFDSSARSRLAALASKTTVTATADFEAAYPLRWGARLTIETIAGETLSADCPVCKGDPESPVGADELRTKAAMLFEHGGVSPERAGALIEAVLALPCGGSLPAIDDLREPIGTHPQDGVRK
jgi:2-methylcitrate dehydratase PrpD